MRAPVSLTWWGHATTTIEIDDVRVLTDPVLTRRLGHLSRIRGTKPATRARAADIVAVSHLHGDHLHVPSMKLVPQTAQVVGPRGSQAVLGGAESRVREVVPGDVVERDGLTIRAVPADHDPRRHSRSRISGPALGFIIERDGCRIWFAGDTALFEGMAEFGPVDLAVVPIGGWGPTLEPDKHMDPEHAAQAVRLVGARYAVPMHYGTFWPTGLRHVHRPSFRRLFIEPAERFRTAVEAIGAEPRVLQVGETTRWPTT
ncbi:MBL fold metallo-hydrolase [Solicola gregarius]|uniref:MBL fold metallo-hydrolase n=1 Tax=Solicola gregarius TaxID=2908642 RepID=A0AA46TFV0_9ACTN|nr:MBL fold metallo-hydrolase [Solicola gregarius]UYM04546.1 MBL fold metallo-hydrolase [Solicola gregarius]